MSDNSSSSSGGIGLVGVLTIVFIVLKLVHVIGWSWVWVLSPLWISFGLSVSFWVLAMMLAFIIAAVRR